MEWADAALFLAFKSIVVPEQGDFERRRQGAFRWESDFFDFPLKPGSRQRIDLIFLARSRPYDEYRKLIEDFRNGKTGD